MLTRKQKDLLLFIHERMAGGDIAPSFDEMREALGLKSKSGIHRLITGLVERGYLERLPHRARALQVKRLPDGHDLSSNITNIDQFRNTQQSTVQSFESIPLCGKIAAGTPIEAISHDGPHVDIPPSLLSNAECYALEVDGDSMIEAGINDGDTVIIEKCSQAEDGAIIVALVDGEEVTLKRLKRDVGKVILVPENQAYEPLSLEPNRVQIQGRLVSLHRSYH